METPKVEFEQLIARGCGIDVHKETLTATVLVDGLEEESRVYSTFTKSLEDLSEWLISKDITHVAIESTGVYWKPVFNILEEKFKIILVNARHTKNVPGRKTDKNDSRWINKLLSCGLLNASFIPPRDIRDLRDLCRYKRKLVNQIASEKNRLQKILEDCNIKLSSVISDMSGVSASRIIDAIISGREDVVELSSLCVNRILINKREQLAESLYGRVTSHHRFMLQTIKKSIESIESIIEIVDAEIDKQAQAYSIEIDLLQTIPGVGKEASVNIIAEIGVDMDVFPDEHHLASWAGMSPGNNESAGKKKSGRTTNGDKYLKAILTQCGWAASRTKGTFYRSKFESLVGRRGKKRALIAIGHKILCAAYFIIKKKEPFKELGYEYLESRRQNKAVSKHLSKLKELGFEVQIRKVA
jgi:transposase